MKQVCVSFLILHILLASSFCFYLHCFVRASSVHFSLLFPLQILRDGLQCCCRFTVSVLKFPPKIEINHSSERMCWIFCSFSIGFLDVLPQWYLQSLFKLISRGKYVDLTLLVSSLHFWSRCFSAGFEWEAGGFFQSYWTPLKEKQLKRVVTASELKNTLL